jgi:hypothetical protein
VAKRVGDALILVTTYRSGARADVELDVVSADEGTELRPLTVTATDAEGNARAEPVQASSGEPAPRFRRPEEGVWTFAVSWPGGQGEVCIELKAPHGG